MRKWTYLVAALLVGGATTTFTGCIDNDEPAGIEQLRGAKAEFIKAKAAYEDALTQIQLVKVEREKVKLEKNCCRNFECSNVIICNCMWFFWHKERECKYRSR